MGYAAQPGLRASLQFDYIDHRKLHYRSHAVSSSSVAVQNDADVDQEVEHDRVNRYFTFGLADAPQIRLGRPESARGRCTFSLRCSRL